MWAVREPDETQSRTSYKMFVFVVNLRETFGHFSDEETCYHK